MRKELKKMFPQWCGDTKTKYELILSDDADSLLCYWFENKVNKREVKYFIDFNSNKGKQVLYKEKNHVRKEKTLGLDFAMERGYCWDNHVVGVAGRDKVNEDSANVNRINNIRAYNYNKKACISSFITILSYYNFDLKKVFDDEQLAVVCAIDGLYLPFTERNRRYKKTAIKNLSLLGYDFLAEWIPNHLDLILEIESKYNLKNGKIWVDKNTRKLTTNIDLEGLGNELWTNITLPNAEFEPYKEYIKEQGFVSTKENLIKDKNVKLFNFALNYGYKQLGVWSYTKIKERKEDE